HHYPKSDIPNRAVLLRLFLNSTVPFNRSFHCSSCGRNENLVVGSRYTEKLESLISDFKNPTETKLLVGHDGTDGKPDWTFSSDHGPFHKAEIPFLYFGNEDHASYHKPTDDFEYITPEFYKNAVRIIYQVLRDLDAKGL
ncbi:MAG: M28 family peptidase, partial [Winogradskyella sp.]|uniref:M28 family peptidase n=1 Tax=Winogradskyella sp. TaxID=1883156 RepID=UPI00184DF962